MYEDPELVAVGRSGHEIWEMDEEELIPLPEGADLMLLPGRLPLGLEPSTGRLQSVAWSGKKEGRLFAVAAILPAGFTRTLLPAYEEPSADKDWPTPLPLFGYTAVAMRDGQVYAAAVRTDDYQKWNPLFYNYETLPGRIAEKRRLFPGNRIVEQLARCSLEYRCLTAQNFFYERWEAGLPVSPSCNARCLGCISLQSAECCPSPQQRINFAPTVEEIAEVGIHHLTHASEAIISGGQGCEGEVLTRSDTLAQAVKRIRTATSQGTININTNAGNTTGLAAVCEAGLDSVRISMISARKEVYEAYHRPASYTFEDVLKSIRMARQYGVYTSINLLVIPGLTDRLEEIEALEELIAGTGLNMVQLRNLNIDPDLLFTLLGPPSGEVTGIRGFIERLRRNFPQLVIGNFSRPV
ncbi:MAG: radical SAM protein [Syntrophothermus sp.]